MTPEQKPFGCRRIGDDINKKTLRDEFAMAALQGVVSLRPDIMANCAAKMGVSLTQFHVITSYEIADAMLEARKAGAK